MPTPRALMARLLPAQKSALSEAAVANALLLQTDGRVHSARPRPDDHAVDFEHTWPNV